MKIIEIQALDNGAHRNQTVSGEVTVPDGWAVLPDGMDTPNFPFGKVTVDNSAPPVVTLWKAGELPEPEPEPDPQPTTEERVAALEAENKLSKEQVSAQSAVASITFVTLCEVGTLDMVTASEHAELFAEWAYPIAYTVGQLRRYNGTLYKCVQAHTSQADWTPDTAASLWSVAADPAEEWPAWSQPVGAHDAYSKDAKVSHNGKHWTSSVDNNVWEPGVYGWTEATE